MSSTIEVLLEELKEVPLEEEVLEAVFLKVCIEEDKWKVSKIEIMHLTGNDRAIEVSVIVIGLSNVNAMPFNAIVLPAVPEDGTEAQEVSDTADGGANGPEDQLDYVRYDLLDGPLDASDDTQD